MKISCIDIGGTYIKSGVLEDGVLTDVEETPTDGGGGARAMLSRVAQLVRQTPGVERVGVSTAGEVDARTGVIRLSDNIPGYTGLNPRHHRKRENYRYYSKSQRKFDCFFSIDQPFTYAMLVRMRSSFDVKDDISLGRL